MKFLERDWYVKNVGKYPPLALGISLAVIRLANEMGLRVPRVIQISGGSIGVEIVPGALDLSNEGLASLSFPDTSSIRLELAKLMVFDYCLANVNLRENGEFVRDADNYPCYSERHPKNILWDGFRIWYIDFGHVFCRHLALFESVVVPKGSLFDTIPPQRHTDFLGLAMDSVRWFAAEAVAWVRDEIVKKRGRGSGPLFRENLWLPQSVATSMEMVFLHRLNQLESNP